MSYELWDTHSRNRIAEFRTKRAAMANVRYALQHHGPASVATLALVYENSDGESTTIAIADELLAAAPGAARREPNDALSLPRSAGAPS